MDRSLVQPQPPPQLQRRPQPHRLRNRKCGIIPKPTPSVRPGDFHPSFAADVEAALERHGAAPHTLWVEITETALLKRSPEIDDGLKRLRGLGIRIALDDFGTGYSSLHLINTLNVDIVKVDRSFVTGISDSEDRRALVAAVIKMADAFGLDTVAEGIESEADIATIRELGATAAQGYWYGKPVPATDFKERWIKGSSNPSPRREEAGWLRTTSSAPAPTA